MRENRLKAKLAAGEPAYGCSVMIPSPQIVEMVAHAGFDWVLIDMEHGTIGLESAELMIMAAEACGATPIVRPTGNSTAEITAAMDRGAAGVQVPHVNTVEDARRAVSAVKFGAGDGRGLAAGTRPDRYGLAEPMPDFVARSNAESLVCIQLEHSSAIDNVDALLAVDEVDVYFIGPSDLSQSMGHPGNPSAPLVERAIDRSLEKILAAGKTAGMPAGADKVERVRERGVRYIYTHLPKLLGAGIGEYLRAADR
ncbi:MAG: aldolase/citrate lyase family protein [Gammaproteobacteria bacterium]|nr:aldolase/citrate lyase family protein [Gammaproteobacteria bacterium]